MVSASSLDLVESFTGVDVLVVGESILDGWLAGPSLRLSREAPVPVVTVGETSLAAGGAANTAVNLAGLGARVRFLSVTGADADGMALRETLRERGVPDDLVLLDPGRRTLAKRRVLAGEQMLVRFDEGTSAPLAPRTEGVLLDRLDRLAGTVDLVVVSDYGCGLLSDAAVARLAALQRRDPRLLVVDARDPARWRDVGPTAVKPNAHEVVSLLDGVPLRGPDRAAAVEAAGERVLAAAGAHVAAVTLDTDGAVILERGRPPYRLYSAPVAHSQAAGAGDSFTAAFALALGRSADGPTAGELAVAAARVVLRRAGTCVCTADELRAALLDGGDAVVDLPRLSACVRAHRLRGRRIVFTNGCFDVLHRGHVTYLNRAKALGDVLVVGLNSDTSVRRLKGSDRPVNPAEDRAAVLSGLSCVDHVVVFEGDSPLDVLDVVRPEVYAKGGDYTTAMLPEAPHVRALGGEIVILPYLEDRSTTGILARIRAGTGGAR